MRFWRSLPGALVLLVTFAGGLALGALVVQVHQATHPRRVTDQSTDLAALLVRVKEIRFPASDGVDLAGWLIPGRPGMPAIVLCHDLGGSKSALLQLAVALQKEGFTLLALDFRGHGQSAGGRSSLGFTEKRDVIGAVDFLSAVPGPDPTRVGVFGVGMGAHAAVLAASDRPVIRVLVLDGLYPDASYPLVRKAYEEWRFGVRYLGFLPRAVFLATNLSSLTRERAADVVPSLVGRDLLMVAPAGDSQLAAEMQRMYQSIPEQQDADGNLVTLPSTLAAGLYGENLDHYVRRVCSFFESRLPRG